MPRAYRRTIDSRFDQYLSQAQKRAILRGSVISKTSMGGQGWGNVGRMRRRYRKGKKRSMSIKQMRKAIKHLQKVAIPQPNLVLYNKTTRGISNTGECVWISTQATPTFAVANLLLLNGVSAGEHQKFFIRDLQQIQFASCVEQDQLVDIYVCQWRTDSHEDNFATEYLTDGFTDVYGAGDSTKPHVNIFMNKKFCTKIKILKSKRMKVQAGKNYKFTLKQAQTFNFARTDLGGVTESVSFLRGSKFLLFKCLGTVCQDQTNNSLISYGQSGLNVVWTGDMRAYISADTKVNVNDTNAANLGTITTAEFVGDTGMELETAAN